MGQEKIKNVHGEKRSPKTNVPDTHELNVKRYREGVSYGFSRNVGDEIGELRKTEYANER